MKIVLRLMLAICVLSVPLVAQTKADNTKVNERDRNDAKLTPDKQIGSRSDTETTRLIRRAIVADKELSMYAHNIKIITKNGMVTLRGPVRTEQERQTVVAKAAEVAGKDHVKSEIEIAPAKPAKDDKATPEKMKDAKSKP